MTVDRRDFAKMLGATALALSPTELLGKTFSEPKPKSIHTWLNSNVTQIYNYDVDVRINDFPTNPSRKWLYYLSLQVNFTGHKEWSHGGIQWSGTREFRNNGNKGINWGGGSEWAGYGGIGVTNTPFTWELGKWYRYRVWRLSKGKDGLWRWLFAVMDYETGKEKRYGTVRTKSAWIKNAVVFTETGYGVVCGTPRIHVDWRNPVFRSTRPGILKPTRGIATYNGTCGGESNTEQGLVSRNPLSWFHSTNKRRSAAYNTRLW